MHKIALDSADIRILKHLQQHARASNNELAEVAHLSPSQCHRRVKRLEEQGIIVGYRTMLNPAAVGIQLTIFIAVSLDAHGHDPAQSFIDAISDVPEVLECYSVTGDTDYLIKACLPDLAAMSQFLMHGLIQLPGVSSIKTSVVVDEIVRRFDLPLKG